MTRTLLAFAKDQNGTAAIEFAFVLPILLILSLGIFEVAGVISADMRLANSAQLIADLVAQQTNETTALTSNFCTGGKMALAPLPTTTLKTSIASVTHGAGGAAVDWQDTTCGGGSTIANATALAAAVTPNVGDSVIIVQVTYSYVSPVSYVLSAAHTLTATSYARPRNVASVTHS